MLICALTPDGLPIANTMDGAVDRAAIEAVDCSLLFVAPYSPDFAPIEQAFAKIKGILRSVGARTKEALEVAIAHALDGIAPQGPHGFFRRCAFHVPHLTP